MDRNSEKQAIIQHLEKSGMLETVDTALIEIYLDNLEEYQEHLAYFKDNEKTIDTYDKEGNLKYAQPHPRVSLMKENKVFIIKISGELGLSPKARKALQVENKLEKKTALSKLKESHDKQQKQGITIRKIG